jgi:uncharacterized delta-60 repeat protein
MRTKLYSTLLTVTLSLITVFAIPFAWGDLDPTFSGDGKLLDGIAKADEYGGRNVVVQPNGKILYGGTTYTGSRSAMGLTRYNPDGTLDASFGSGGKVITDLGPSGGGLTSLALQSDGKIVGVGYAHFADGSSFAVTRYLPNGTLDVSFDGDGRVTTLLCNNLCQANATSVAIQTDGKLVVAGQMYSNGSGYDFGLVRYNSDGSLDTSLNGTGKVFTQVGPADDYASEVTVQPDGKILIAGSAYDESHSQGRFAIVRYNPNGTLDQGFTRNGGGKLFVSVESGSYASAISVQPDGKIVAAGAANTAGVYSFAVIRCDSSGELDQTFSGDGIVVTPFGGAWAYASSTAIQPNGKIVVAGESQTGNSQHFGIARYNTDGSLDNSFDNDGRVITPIGNWSRASSVSLDANGKLLAAGESNFDSSLSMDLALARYEVNGAPDTSFDFDGVLSTDFGFFSNNFLYDVAIQPDGKIVTVGEALYQFGVARYNRDGSPDATFGDGDGKVVTRLTFSYTAPYAVALQPDGKIISAGYACEDCDNFGAPYVVIVRYNPNGTLDSEFGASGVVRMPSLAITSISSSLVIQPDGKLIAAGWIWNGSQNQFLLLRFLSNGSLDSTFDGDGIVTTSVTEGSSLIADIALQPDGKIVAVGTGNVSPAPSQIVAARYNADGSLDTSFDGDGKVITSIANGAHAKAVALQRDGKIVVAGQSLSNTDTDITVVRYNVDGSLDSSLDNDGKIITPISPDSYDQANDLALDINGRIVVAGSSSGGNDGADFCVLAYNADGSVDTTFGTGGKVITDFGTTNDYAEAVALDGKRNIVVTGNSSGAFALARYRAAPNSAVADFDGDGRSDVSVFRPSNQAWYLDQSTEGFRAVQFGLATDVLAPADFDGDGKSDIAVFRNGVWWRFNSGDSTIVATQFGIASDVPVPADYTGDGRDEIAIFRNGQWWMHDLSNGQSFVVNFGLIGDKPVAADYDGDGRVDQAIYRNGEWHLNRSSLGYATVYFGLASDRPVVGDYDADGDADPSVFRDGVWYLSQSTQGFKAFQFGIVGDVPVPGDYDGDGKTDAAIFRNGVWYVNKSTGGVDVRQFGLPGDRPIESVY